MNERMNVTEMNEPRCEGKEMRGRNTMATTQ